jgi:hypothetical protein
VWNRKISSRQSQCNKCGAPWKKKKNDKPEQDEDNEDSYVEFLLLLLPPSVFLPSFRTAPLSGSKCCHGKALWRLGALLHKLWPLTKLSRYT